MKKIFTISLLLAIFCASGVVKAATVTWDGDEDEFWSNPLNWDSDILPSSGDSVVIPAGNYVEIDINSTIQSLTILGGVSGSIDNDVVISDNIVLTILENLQINGGTSNLRVTTLQFGNNSIVLVKNLEINAGANVRAAIDMGGDNSELYVSGNFTLSSASGTLTSSPNSSVIINGSSDQSIAISGGTNGVNYSNLIINKPSGVATFLNSSGQINPAAISSSLYVQSGTLSNNGYLFNGSFTSSLTVDASAKFLITGTVGYPVFSGTNTLADNATVEFGGTNQTISLPAGQQPNLVLSGSGTKTLSGNIAANDLAIQSGVTFVAGNNLIEVNKDFITDGIFTPGISTVSFVGTSAATKAGSCQFYNLTLNKAVTFAGADTVQHVLSIAAGASSISGSLAVNLNTGYVDPEATGGTIGGTIRFFRPAKSAGYNFLSFPVNTTIAAVKANGFSHAFTFDQSKPAATAFTTATGSTAFGRGYAMYSASQPTVSVSGAYDNSITNHAVTLNSTLQGDPAAQVAGVSGFNLIGNPYPFELDWDELMLMPSNASNLYKAMYFYQGSSYSTYVAGVPAGQGFIPSFQGFFVYMDYNFPDVTSTSILNLDRSAAVAGTNPLRRTAPITNVLKLTVSNGTNADPTYVRLTDDATVSFDSDYDAFKLKNGGNVPNLYSYLGNDIYSINSVPASFDTYSMPLAFEAKVAGEYTIALSEEYTYDLPYEILLEDKHLNVFHSLTANSLYIFTTNLTENAGRFELHFGNPTITSIGTAASEKKDFRVFCNQKTVSVEGFRIEGASDIALVDLSGKHVAEYKDVDLKNKIFTFDTQVNSGVYFVRIQNGEHVYSSRIVIGN